MVTNRERERDVIITSPKRRPYGARLALFLEESVKFKIDGECTLLASSNYIIRISPNPTIPAMFRLSNHQCWDIFIEAFSNAGEAEQIGLKVALGFLWSAISGQYAARLVYNTPLPCSVYDRTKSQGLTITAWGHAELLRHIKSIVEPLDRVLSSREPADQKLLVAMELFASSRLETTERSRFVGMVSSLEPLANQETNEDPDLKILLSLFQRQLQESVLPQNIKEAIRDKIDLLKVESVSKAIRRLVRELLPEDSGAAEVIDEAYHIRSRILHDGLTDADLELRSREAEAVIRRIFQGLVIRRYGS